MYGLVPKSTLELFESRTQRSLTEREVKSTTEVISRSELSTTNQEELSNSIKQDNQRNEAMAFSVSAGGSTPVFHAEASLNYNVNKSYQMAQETAHKTTRQQSTKVSNEIRRSLETRFRTLVETTDVTTRRYVLQNDTNKIINYELRRKLRKVCVQLQHIGTQLCWQIYVENPGMDLGIAKLIHVAKPNDTMGIQEPDRPKYLEPVSTKVTIRFPFDRVTSTDYNGDNTYVDHDQNGKKLYDENNLLLGVSGLGTIRFQRYYDATPPAIGYTLAGVEENNLERVAREIPVFSAKTYVPVRDDLSPIEKPGQDISSKFLLTLR